MKAKLSRQSCTRAQTQKHETVNCCRAAAGISPLCSEGLFHLGTVHQNKHSVRSSLSLALVGEQPRRERKREQARMDGLHAVSSDL